MLTSTLIFPFPVPLNIVIFCGSKNYPERGYLEALAIKFFSNGTNAWTNSDHTAYTVSMVGTHGLKYILPMFLDHIINPKLTNSDFITEVSVSTF